MKGSAVLFYCILIGLIKSGIRVILIKKYYRHWQRRPGFSKPFHRKGIHWSENNHLRIYLSPRHLSPFIITVGKLLFGIERTEKKKLKKIEVFTSNFGHQLDNAKNMPIFLVC